MKMGSRETCLESVAHNVDKNIPDDAPHAANIRGNSTRRPGCFHVVHWGLVEILGSDDALGFHFHVLIAAVSFLSVQCYYML